MEDGYAKYKDSVCRMLRQVPLGSQRIIERHCEDGFVYGIQDSTVSETLNNIFEQNSE